VVTALQESHALGTRTWNCPGFVNSSTMSQIRSHPGAARRPGAGARAGDRDREVVPDAWAAAPGWHRDRNIPWASEAAARVALDPWDDEGDAPVREPAEREVTPITAVTARRLSCDAARVAVQTNADGPR
jgi:hypothetical protein